MVDVQEQQLGKRHPKGRRIKSELLHKLVGRCVTVVDDSGEASVILRYETESGRGSPGFYLGNRQLPISEVHRVYLDQNRIELYPSQSGVKA